MQQELKPNHNMNQKTKLDISFTDIKECALDRYCHRSPPSFRTS
jgi:hypothetical protein